jgi:hypothetical protein
VTQPIDGRMIWSFLGCSLLGVGMHFLAHPLLNPLISVVTPLALWLIVHAALSTRDRRAVVLTLFFSLAVLIAITLHVVLYFRIA